MNSYTSKDDFNPTKTQPIRLSKEPTQISKRESKRGMGSTQNIAALLQVLKKNEEKAINKLSESEALYNVIHGNSNDKGSTKSRNGIMHSNCASKMQSSNFQTNPRKEKNAKIHSTFNTVHSVKNSASKLCFPTRKNIAPLRLNFNETSLCKALVKT